MSYDLFQHRHNFAVWAAARATQRGFTTTANLRDALEYCGISRFLSDPTFVEITKERFEKLHIQWSDLIIKFLKDRKISAVTYGRAAKLVAIYLKTMVIIGGSAYTNLGRCAHPPIDSKTLQAIAQDPQIDKIIRKRFRSIKWTQLGKPEYYKLVNQLRALFAPEIAFWMIEEYWTVADEDD